MIRPSTRALRIARPVVAGARAARLAAAAFCCAYLSAAAEPPAAADAAALAELVRRVDTGEIPAHRAPGLSAYRCDFLAPGLAPRWRLLQHIEGRAYRWREYHDDGDGDGLAEGFCIVAERPALGRLDRPQAQALLSASLLWQAAPQRQRAAGPSTSTPKTEPWVLRRRLALPPQRPQRPRVNAGGTRVRQLFGDDDRVQVADPTAFPFSTIGFLTSGHRAPGTATRSTGFMISPFVALTAAHSVYDAGFGGFIDYAALAPAQFTRDGDLFEPFTLQYAFGFATNATYIDIVERSPNDERQFDFDFGALYFRDPFPGLNTFMPLAFDRSPAAVMLSGYPGVVRGEATLDQWFSSGAVERVAPRQITYLADGSAGTSGGPVWALDPVSNTTRAIAVHTFGQLPQIDPLFADGGTRLLSADGEFYQDLLDWTPPPRSGGLINISTQGIADGSPLAAGFIITGTRARRIVVLGENVDGLPDPVVRITDLGGSRVFDQNDDLFNHPTVEEVIVTQRPPGSALDAGLAITLAPGTYLAQLSDLRGRRGRGLISLTDVDGTTPDGRLLNISTRGGMDERGMTAGFIVEGPVARRFAIFAEAVSLPDPTLRVTDLSGQTLFASNDDWRQHRSREQVLELREPRAETDAAVVISLQPGVYLATIRDSQGRSGSGDIGVSELP